MLLWLTIEMQAGWLLPLPYSWSWLHFPAEAAAASWASPLPRSHSVPLLLSLCLASVAWLVTPGSSLEQVKGERNPQEMTLLKEKKEGSCCFPNRVLFPFLHLFSKKTCWWSKKFLITQVNIFFFSLPNFKTSPPFSPLQSFVRYLKSNKTLMWDVAEGRSLCFPVLWYYCRKLFPYILAASSFHFFFS